MGFDLLFYSRQRMETAKDINAGPKKKAMGNMKKIPQVAIVIVNWNGRELLQRCLSSIEKNTQYPNYRIIVVDNGSTDGSVQLIEEKFPNVHVIRNRENLGFSRANNQGMKHALKTGASYIFLLNNDTEVVQEDWLGTLVDALGRDEKIGILGCKVFYPDGRLQLSAGWMGPLEWKFITKAPEESIEVEVVNYCAALIKKEVIERIGLLDEGFSPFFWEEYDYCARARKAGFKIAYHPAAAITHYGGTSIKKKEDDFRFFNYRKNRIRFVLLNFPLAWLPWAIIFEFLSLFLEKKTPGVRLTPMNIALRRGAARRFGLFLKTLRVNLRNLGEILQKRRNRTMKIWC